MNTSEPLPLTPENQKSRRMSITPPSKSAMSSERLQSLKKTRKEEHREMRELGDEKLVFAEATKECALCKINTDDQSRLANLGELMQGKPLKEHPEMIRKCVVCILFK